MGADVLNIKKNLYSSSSSSFSWISLVVLFIGLLMQVLAQPKIEQVGYQNLKLDTTFVALEECLETKLGVFFVYRDHFLTLNLFPNEDYNQYEVSCKAKAKFIFPATRQNPISEVTPTLFFECQQDQCFEETEIFVLTNRIRDLKTKSELKYIWMELHWTCEFDSFPSQSWCHRFALKPNLPRTYQDKLEYDITEEFSTSGVYATSKKNQFYITEILPTGALKYNQIGYIFYNLTQPWEKEEYLGIPLHSSTIHPTQPSSSTFMDYFIFEDLVFPLAHWKKECSKLPAVVYDFGTSFYKFFDIRLFSIRPFTNSFTCQLHGKFSLGGSTLSLYPPVFPRQFFMFECKDAFHCYRRSLLMFMQNTKGDFIKMKNWKLVILDVHLTCFTKTQLVMDVCQRFRFTMDETIEEDVFLDPLNYKRFEKPTTTSSMLFAIPRFFITETEMNGNLPPMTLLGNIPYEEELENGEKQYVFLPFFASNRTQLEHLSLQEDEYITAWEHELESLDITLEEPAKNRNE